MNDWFTESFGEDYKVVYRHRNQENAEREIAAMMVWMDLQPGSVVLDIGCGMGRHAQALRSLGYVVTGLDLSEVLLSEARHNDPEANLVWVKGDMRQLPFLDGKFEATVNLFTSFGYFDDIQDNVRVLEELKRVLRPSGRYLIDYLNPTYVVRHLVPLSERIDGPSGLCITERRVIEDDFVVKNIEVKPPVDHTGTRAASRHYQERVRLIRLEQFKQMLTQAGLLLDHVYGDYDGSSYRTDSSKRLILLGRRE